MNRQKIPDDDDMARLIAVSFDALPGPDDERLAAVGERLQSYLHSPPKRKAGRHWVWLLLIVGGSAVAWWGGSALFDGDLKVNGVDATQSQTITDPEKGGEAPVEQEMSGKRRQSPEHDTPVIYRREVD